MDDGDELMDFSYFVFLNCTVLVTKIEPICGFDVHVYINPF